MFQRKLRIGVIGASECSAEIYTLAEQVGREIAAANAILICGGRTGAMEAAARGALQAGGLTVGILPGESDAEANPFIEIPIVTGMGQGRNIINVWTSEALIAIAGGYGTLSEIALALKTQTPVVGLRTWEFRSAEFPHHPGFHPAQSPQEAVAKAVALARQRRRA